MGVSVKDSGKHGRKPTCSIYLCLNVQNMLFEFCIVFDTSLCLEEGSLFLVKVFHYLNTLSSQPAPHRKTYKEKYVSAYLLAT